MRNSAADGVSRRSALDGLVAETAAGRLLPGVHRCLLRVETPRWPEGWTGAATTHRDDRGGLDADVAPRMPSVTKIMTATALLVLGDQGRCRLDDPTGRHLPSDVVDRFHDRQGAYGAGITSASAAGSHHRRSGCAEGLVERQGLSDALQFDGP
jgi:CubicO group peptidase (beta-lactamase class C family)